MNPTLRFMLGAGVALWGTGVALMLVAMIADFIMTTRGG